MYYFFYWEFVLRNRQIIHQGQTFHIIFQLRSKKDFFGNKLPAKIGLGFRKYKIFLIHFPYYVLLRLSSLSFSLYSFHTFEFNLLIIATLWMFKERNMCIQTTVHGWSLLCSLQETLFIQFFLRFHAFKLSLSANLQGPRGISLHVD